MKYLKLFFVSSTALACAAAFAGQALGVSVKKWQAYYDQGAALFHHLDAKGISAVLTPDWKSFSPNGKVTQSGNDVNELEKTFAGLRSMNVHFKVLSVKGDRNAVIVRTTFMFSAETKPGPDKKTHRMTQKGVSNERWVHRNGKWLMAETRAIKETDTMDGKPMPAGGH